MSGVGSEEDRVEMVEAAAREEPFGERPSLTSSSSNNLSISSSLSSSGCFGGS